MKIWNFEPLTEQVRKREKQKLQRRWKMAGQDKR